MLNAGCRSRLHNGPPVERHTDDIQDAARDHITGGINEPQVYGQLRGRRTLVH